MSLLTRVAWGAAKALGVSVAIEERAAKLSAAAMSARALPDQSLWNQFQRVAGATTPSQVSSIIREADTGDMARLMDLANECRQKDCHLQAILSQSEESIAGLEWQLKLPESARAKDKRAMKFVEESLRTCPDFLRMLAHQAGAVFYGSAVSETMWVKKDGKLVPGTFVNHPPRRFSYRPVDGAFIWRDQGMSWEGIEIQKEFPGKFVVSHPRVNGDVPCREGLVRPLVWAVTFRTWDMTDWLKTAEMAWKPWRIGTYENSSDTEGKEALENAAKYLTTSGWATIHKSTKLDVQWPAGNSSTKATHAELYSVLAQEMSKAVLGQTETTQASGSSGYAQAKVHERVSATLIESRAKAIAATITRDLIRPMVEWNFGKGYAIPEFELSTQNPVDLASFASAIGQLVAAGADITQAWVRDQIGAPEPKEGEALLKKPVASAPVEEKEPEEEDGKEDTEPPAEGEEDDTKDEEPAEAA
jgi:phage gp29-like protein